MTHINHRHIIAFCSVLSLAAAGNHFFHSSIQKTETTALTSELSEKLLRFRVLANSDSSADQFQKNQVSEELVSLLRPLLTECCSKQDAVQCIEKNLPYLEKQANQLAASYGTSYPVTCTLSSHLFPIKTYQNLTFPAGEYDTLLVTIGSGMGSNWWCLAYPPLCFASEAYVAVPSSTDDTLKEILDEETYQTLSAASQQTNLDFDWSSTSYNNAAQMSEKEQTFCFRLFPFLNKWFQ